MNNTEIKDYIKRNIIPIIIELVFIASCFFVPNKYIVYTNCLFYVLLFIYFSIKKEINIKEWLLSFKSGKQYWIQVILTLIAFLGTFIITIILENLFPDLDTGTINLRRDNWLTLIAFSISTILLPSITEETFFRKNMILLSTKKTIFVTTALSMFLYALEHSLSWWGILLTMIWALPLSVSYIMTKNIYVVMTAHFIGNLLGNGFDVINALLQFLK